MRDVLKATFMGLLAALASALAPIEAPRVEVHQAHDRPLAVPLAHHLPEHKDTPPHEQAQRLPTASTRGSANLNRVPQSRVLWGGGSILLGS